MAGGFGAASRRACGAVVRSGVGLAALALPVTCGGCGRLGEAWCADCARDVARAAAVPLVVGGRAGRACAPDGPVVACAPYDGPVARAVVAFKDGDRRDLVSVLAPILRASLIMAGSRCPPDEPVLIVPAPSSARARRRRGDVPTHLLVREALRGTDVLGLTGVWAPVLRHARRVRDQAGLSRADRAGNTDHAFAVADPRVRHRRVIVVDDVVTTGATAAECVRALRVEGARPVAVAALAATLSDRRDRREVRLPGSR